MSSIPAAKEWLTALHADLCHAAFPTTSDVFTASGPKASHVADAVAEVLYELSRLETELASETQRRLTFYDAIRQALGCGSKPMLDELPAEVAKLRAERDEALVALKPFADAAEMFAWPVGERNSYRLNNGCRLTVGDLRRAASLITKGGADV